MNYDQKIESARAIVEQFNNNTELKVSWDRFLADLKALGGTTNDALKMCSWEDLQSCGMNNKIEADLPPRKLPRLIARQIAAVFRKSPDKSGPKVITEKRALRLSPQELLEAYQPYPAAVGCYDPAPVEKRLMQLSRNQPCIVFENQTNKVHIKASLACLEDILDGQEPLPHYLIDGIPHRIYPVGHCPSRTVAENPLFPGYALRGSDEICHKTTRSWKQIPHEARIILRLALGTSELKIVQVGDVHNTLDLVAPVESCDSCIQKYSTRFPQAALKYADLAAQGNLPKLTIVRGSKSKPKQDPFYSGHTTY